VASGGEHGEIPIPVAQAIMIEYNIPILETDFRYLKAQGMINKDLSAVLWK